MRKVKVIGMKKRNLIGCMTAAALALTTLCGGTVYAEEGNADYVKGDINGDRYIGTEDAVYSVLSASNYAIPEEAVLPTMVQYMEEAVDVDGDGVPTWADSLMILKAVVGEYQWDNGYHKITSSDKSEVTYKYDGEYVIASVSIKKLTDTAVIYDKTKVEYVEDSWNYDKSRYQLFGTVYNNEEQGIVNTVFVCPFDLEKSDDIRFGTVDLKFKVKDNVSEVTLGSCTGGGFIQDNTIDDDNIVDVAKRYEEALYTEENVKTFSVSLSDAQQILKTALNINTTNADSNVPADMNDDGQVTLEDAKLALQVALKIISINELK